MYCEKLVLERSPGAAEKSSAGAVALFLLPWAGSAGCKGGRERGKETLTSGALIKLISSVPRTPRAGGLTKSSTPCTNTIISLTIARATGKSLGQSRPTRNFENERPFTMPCHPLSASAPSANDRQGFSETSTRRLRSMDASHAEQGFGRGRPLQSCFVEIIPARFANHWRAPCEPSRRPLRTIGARCAT